LLSRKKKVHTGKRRRCDNGVTTSSNSTFLVVITTHGTVYKSFKDTHTLHIYTHTQRMSALSLSTPIHTASTLSNARVSSRRTRVSSIKASCSSITLGAPSSRLEGLENGHAKKPSVDATEQRQIASVRRRKKNRARFVLLVVVVEVFFCYR